jgi:hypothetical protein
MSAVFFERAAAPLKALQFFLELLPRLVLGTLVLVTAELADPFAIAAPRPAGVVIQFAELVGRVSGRAHFHGSL